ncbi:alpha/beta hydrolase family protein [Bradyrhizobium sp.]|jgi:predicted dienelactone hydrolase|uniref:alpha/beta hydrolase family protein n=1 Tax=Bradyrhizobium sp. TaxID=376 RepID=UPI003C1584E3
MPVGFRQGCFEDAARSKWDGSGPRPLSWAAWYPAAEDVVEQELRAGDTTAAWFAFGSAAPDAPIGQIHRRYPIVLLSHGTGGAAFHLEWLASDLARHGFIAVAMNHHGNTTTEPYRAEGFLAWWERARDLTVLLDLIASESAFAGHVDLNRVYVAGYSLGGCTVAALLGAITETSRFERSPRNKNFGRGPREFPDLADHLPGLLESSAIFRDSWARMSDSYLDPRVRAALILAPGNSVLGCNEDSLRSITTPNRIVVGGSDFVLPVALWLHERLPTSALDRLAPEAGHYVFMPEATEAGRLANPACCIDAPGVDRRSVHQHTAALAAELFRAA